ncbi:MAG: Hint domain-containing protein [Planctomycetota bacterium]|jgi:hypothetical protein
MGLLDSIFGGDGGDEVSFATIPQTPEAQEARRRIAAIAAAPPPEVPLRGTAPIPPLGEERQLARTTAKELIQPQDIFSLPEVQGIIQEANVTGNLLANRLGRALQASGNITSTSGRDVLGRAVTEIQKSLASQLAPFATEERRRRTGLIPTLEGLGLMEELRKQGFTQAQLDALFQKETTESQQLQTFTIPLLQSIIEQQPGVQPIIPGQRPSNISQVAPLVGPILGGILQSKGGAGKKAGGGIDWVEMAMMAGSAKLLFACIPEGTVIDTFDGQRKVEDIRAGDEVCDKNGNRVKVVMKYEFDESPTSDRFIELTFDSGHSVTVCDMHRIDGVFAKDLEVGDKGLASKKFVRMDKRSYDLMTSGSDGSYRSNGIPINTMIPELNSLIQQKIQKN